MTNPTNKRKPKLDLVWDMPIKEALRCVTELTKHLSINEENYLLIAGYSLKDSRSYVIYIALDEVIKTSIHLMRLRDLLDEKDGTERQEKKERTNRLVTISILEEQQMRTRRLLELLVTLILFSNTNEDHYYRHLLLLEDLQQNSSDNTDFQEFWGQRSANIDDHIKSQIQWINQIETSINLDLCWYLNSKKPISTFKKSKLTHILSSFRNRLMEALPLMTDLERNIVGYTYNGAYGRSSEAIHYHSNRHDNLINYDDLMRMVRRLGLLINLILDRCYHLLDKPDAPRLKRISKILESHDKSTIVNTQTVGSGEVGDFVLVYDDIAEIIEIKESGYGYRSYKVHYLAEKPKPNIPDDWFPANYIQVYYPKQKFLEKWNTYIKSENLPTDIQNVLANISEDELQLATRQSMTVLWNIILRDQIKRQRRGNK